MKTGYLDASSAILLYKAHLFPELLDTYNMRMAESVYDELTCNGYPDSIYIKKCVVENRITLLSESKFTPKPLQFREDINSLGKGEHDTLMLFQPDRSSFIITDDGKAARCCKKHDLPFLNALLFPRVLYMADRMTEEKYNQSFNMLINIGRYSKNIIDIAFMSSLEELQYFLP